MRVLFFAALTVAALLGCKEKKSTPKTNDLVQGTAPVANAAPQPSAPAENPMNVSGAVAERQSIQNNEKIASGNSVPAPTGEPEIDPSLTKATDATGKEVYYRKQSAPTAAPTAAELQTKKIQVPVSSLAPPSPSRVAFFTGQNFYFSMAARSSEPGIFEKNYKDKWLVFKSDQNFEIYKKSELIGKGRWTFRDSDNIIFLSCDDPYINNSWKMQNMPGAIMFLGNTELNKTGIQARLFMSNEKPH